MKCPPKNEISLEHSPQRLLHQKIVNILLLNATDFIFYRNKDDHKNVSGFKLRFFLHRHFSINHQQVQKDDFATFLDFFKQLTV
jgi:hypothetical protein